AQTLCHVGRHALRTLDAAGSVAPIAAGRQPCRLSCSVKSTRIHCLWSNRLKREAVSPTDLHVTLAAADAVKLPGVPFVFENAPAADPPELTLHQPRRLEACGRSVGTCSRLHAAIRASQPFRHPGGLILLIEPSVRNKPAFDELAGRGDARADFRFPYGIRLRRIPRGALPMTAQG